MIAAGVETEKKPIALFGQTMSVQQFRNALAMFVDVDQGTSYNNLFRAVGDGDKSVVFFRWFAKKRWRREMPVIQRLLRVRRGDARFFLEGTDNASDGMKDEQAVHPDEPLLLFLQRTQQGPFVYCGRLGFLGMRAAMRPLEFLWQLLDADALSWMNVRRQTVDSLLYDDSSKAVKPEPTAELQ